MMASVTDLRPAFYPTAPGKREDLAVAGCILTYLVVTDQILDKVGPAVISQSWIFLYGPTGNGKTSLAERLLRVYQDCILMPYAVEVDQQIITLFDPVVHQRIDITDEEFDPRWVL